MASRQEVHRSKISLKTDLRAQCRKGQLLPGALAPSLRDMAEQYGISTPIVTQASQELVEEGLLHTIPRVGTFVGQHKSSFENYTLLDDDLSAFHQRTNQFRMGFEDRVAQLGGALIKMSPTQLLGTVHTRDLPPVAGVIELVHQSEEFWGNSMFGDSLARVRFCSHIHHESPCDCVSFTM